VAATSDQDSLDPTGAQTPEAFMQLLRQARADSGLSAAEIADRARKRGYDLDPVALDQALDQPTLPAWQTVTGVLSACGLGGMQIDRWMRVYHDLTAPAQPTAPTAPQSPLAELLEEPPVSVPPLVLTTAPAAPSRFGRRHYALAAGALAVLMAVPLVVFAMSGGDPDSDAAEQANAVKRTRPAPGPAPLPSDPVVTPSPTEPGATPTTPAPATTTTRPVLPPPSTGPAPRPSSSPADSGVLRSGVVELLHQQGFDLDTGQVESESDDVFRWDENTLFSNGDRRLEPVSGMPSKGTCQAEQGWEFRVNNLQVGQWLCVRTTGGRYARLNVLSLGGAIRMAYTVWT
jgi:hypothetical protein